METKLQKISIRNFKGIKSFEADFDGDNAVIKGANGSGKTSVYDAFLWLLFGKDSTGRKDFDLRPLNKDNEPIKGLELAVEAVLNIDGTVHTLRKEHHENTVKGQFKGYETLCWIDEVPKKVSEYQEYIAEIIPEDTFKMLTSIRHFSEGLHWKQRREMLLDIAGEIPSPDGFDKLLSALNGRSIDEYRLVLTGQKKRLELEQSEINPRLDEIQRGLTELADVDTSALEGKRKSIQSLIAEFDKKRQSLFAHEKERQQKIETVNALKSKKANREIQLASDTSGVKNLLEEKNKIEAEINELQQKVILAQSKVNMYGLNITSKKLELDSLTRSLQPIRENYAKLKEATTDDTCKLCGQKLPADKIELIEQKRKLELEVVIKQGNEQQKLVKECNTAGEILLQELKAAKESLERAQLEHGLAREEKDQKFAAIDKAMKSNKTTPPEKDSIWLAICEEIKQAEANIGRPVSDQLEIMEQGKAEKTQELTEINNALAQADRTAKDKLRIKELEAKEKDLAQKIADVERQLDDIGQYQAEVSGLIETAVNDRFKHVRFKLFNQLLNGSIEDCCEAMLHGVPYSDCSYGQKILIGIDIINVLSAHYGYAVPLFIDNAESLTLPIEAASQTVKLFATEVKGLQFTKEEKTPEELFTKPSIKKSTKKGAKANV